MSGQGCGCDEVFGRRFARRMTRRYRRRGLDPTARQMVAFVRERGGHGATVLELGGGVGEISLELLKGGARRATTLELSDAYDRAARDLLREAGLEDRAERRIADLAADPAAAEAADVVVLHRVVCCYPDYERLLGAAADHARRLLVFSHPPRTWLSRALIAGENLGFWLRRSDFRVWAHPPEAMLAVLEARGLRRTWSHSGGVWRAVGLER